MGNPTPLPPDRSHVSTERRHPASAMLDTLPTDAFIRLFAEDHRAVARAVERATPALSAMITALVDNVRANGRLIYLGAGTSGRLGVLDAAECPPTFQSDPSRIIGIIAGGDDALRRSSEGLEDDFEGAHDALGALNLGRHDTVIGIAAGGTTPYVRGGISFARSFGATTALLTCASSSEPPDGCNHWIVLDTGPELLAGSTRLKAGSATKLALNIISTALFTQLGKVHGNLMVDLRASNQKLRDRAIRILREFCPDLSREAAAAALERADGRLKIAIVMQCREVDHAAAATLLDQADGRLRAVLER